MILTSSLSLPACSNFSYYSQAIAGHLSIRSKYQAIDDLLASEQTSAQLKQKLASVLEIRHFASQKLSLPDNDSYTSYVELDRPYVLWNVVAAPEFSLEPRQWCFLFAGCVKYRGYFSYDEVMSFAAELRASGDDVYVRGVDAYSTLGWFDDPVLSTFLNRDDVSVAGLIFHELAHQQVYVKNDSAFNEGFAITVELEGVQRWLQAHHSLDLMTQYQERKHKSAAFIELVSKTSTKLKSLYAQTLTDEQKRDRKAQIIQQMRNEYAQLKATWAGYTGYDKWFDSEINNAKLAAVNTYRDFVPAFKVLLQEQHGDLKEFYSAVKSLGQLPEAQRTAKLNSLISQK